jgi:hypothetical protein
MCTTITESREVIFEGRIRECSSCEDGKEYEYTKQCHECNGQKRFLKGKRRYACKTCKGSGYVMRDERLETGACTRCKGTRQVPLTAYDSMTDEDKEWIFANLFNFEKPYARPTSSFNEGYLGLGIVCGVTDYGRYQKMTPDEFYQEVKENFMRGYNQYVSILKDGKLPAEILIKKGNSGWFAYPIYA